MGPQLAQAHHFVVKPCIHAANFVFLLLNKTLLHDLALHVFFELAAHITGCFVGVPFVKLQLLIDTAFLPHQFGQTDIGRLNDSRNLRQGLGPLTGVHRFIGVAGEQCAVTTFFVGQATAFFHLAMFLLVLLSTLLRCEGGDQGPLHRGKGG